VDQPGRRDQDVRNSRVLHQRVQRPQSEDFVEDLIDQILAVGLGQIGVFLGDQGGNGAANLAAHAGRVNLGQPVEVDALQQPPVEDVLKLEVGWRRRLVGV